jgi:hypothetical protein
MTVLWIWDWADFALALGGMAFVATALWAAQRA